MLQQFYVTEKPRKPNEGYIEPEAAKSETGESEKEDKETADCVSLPSPALVPKQIGKTKDECRFSEDIVHVQITVLNVADTTQKASIHHRDVKLTLAEKTYTIDEPERCRRDASGQIRSDLRERKSLIIRTGKSVAYKLHARPPEPPEPADRGLSTAEVFGLVPMSNRVHQSLIINSTQLNNERRVSEEESEMENLKVSFPTIIENKCSFLLHCGEEREARDGRIFSYCFELLLNRVGKIIKLLVRVGRYCINTINIKVKPPLVYWDLGGLTRDGWNLSGTKREKDIQEIVHTSSMECGGIRTYQYQQLLFLKLHPIISFFGYYGGASMIFGEGKATYAIKRFEDLSTATVLLGVRNENGRHMDSVLIHFSHTLKVKSIHKVEVVKYQNVKEKGNDHLQRLDSNLSELRKKEPMGLGLFQSIEDRVLTSMQNAELVLSHGAAAILQKLGVAKITRKGGRKGTMVLGRQDEVRDNSKNNVRIKKWDFQLTYPKQWDPGGNYYASYIIWSLYFQLYDPGGSFLLLFEDHCPIQEMKIVMIRQVAHEDVEVLNNWNQILLFHNFIFHQVIMLALFVILNCEWGAHNGNGIENTTQAWLQTRQEIWVEHLIQGLESSRRPMKETHHKQWDPGEPYLVCYIIGTSCFKLWDPGGRVLIVCFGIFTLRTR